MLRIRDFIETYDNLIFAVVSYYHQKEGYLAFLRYYPHKNGDRRRGNKGFNKVASTKESFDYLEKNYPKHVFYHKTGGAKLQCVPVEKVRTVYHPSEKLEEIISKPKDELEKKVKRISELLDFLPSDKKGVSGSLLVDLYNPKSSDIDFVIYGMKNYEKARAFLKQSFNENRNFRMLNRKEWNATYKKRFPIQKTLSFNDFLWHEKRKYHKGIIDGMIFDILLVRDYDEIKGDLNKTFKRLNNVNARCQVLDSTLAFDSPALYKVQCNENKRITEVASFTHTYTGQAFEGEEIEVSGYLERSTSDNDYRIVVGTTREAVGEYIKVKRD
ncbi:MAG: DNA polymerase subunit beta [Candidatus Hydrothermarchaeales archaeon]